MAQICQCPDDPVIVPARILASHVNDQLGDITPDPRPLRIRPMLRTIELLSDEPAIPGENRIEFGDPRHFFQRFAAEPFADLR